MNKPARWLLILTILSGLIFIIAGLSGSFQRTGALPGGAAADMIQSVQCASCHADVYKEWENSWHAKSYIDPEVRKLSNEYANEQCIDCHAPRPVLETGIDKPPLPRAARRAEGVDCLACHSFEGTMATNSKTAAGACAPRFDARIVNTQLCGTCHDQHFTVQEWAATPFGKDPNSCLSCHMPAATRPNGKSGFAHHFSASHDENELRKVLKITIARDGEALKVNVKNVGAGHQFPTDERSRAADLIVRWTNAAGEIIKIEKLDRYRNPYRDEIGPSDGLPYREESPLLERRPNSTLLPYGVERSYKTSLPDGATTAEILVTYKTIPFPVDAKEVLADKASFDNKKAFLIFSEIVPFNK